MSKACVFVYVSIYTYIHVWTDIFTYTYSSVNWKTQNSKLIYVTHIPWNFVNEDIH